MYWSDLVKVYRRNAVDPARLRFDKTRHGRENAIAIVDVNYPRRAGFIWSNIGEFEDSWWTQAFVANAAWVGGEIPKESVDIGNDVNKYLRGYRRLTEVMLKEGCLRPSTELDKLISGDSRAWVPDDLRFMYVR